MTERLIKSADVNRVFFYNYLPPLNTSWCIVLRYMYRRIHYMSLLSSMIKKRIMKGRRTEQEKERERENDIVGARE